MVEAYLQKQLSFLKDKENIKSSVAGILGNSKEKVSQKVSLKEFKAVPIDLQELIEKYLVKLNAADVDLNLRRAKLREAKRLKKELEGKLYHIAESIENLDYTDKISSKQKLNLMDSQVRHEYFVEEKTKSKETKKKLKEYYKEQKRREEKMKQNLREIEKMIDEEKKIKQDQLKQQKELKEKEYQEYLRKMEDKKNQRKKELNELKNHDKTLEAVKQQKPLFVKFSEDYWKNVEMPELEKRKEELSKKRMIHSISSKQISDHAKWYETVKKDHKKKFENETRTKNIDRKIQQPDSTFTIWKQKIIEEEKHMREEQKRIHDERLKMIDKRTSYANLVKQMHLPSIDEIKHKEIEQRKKKFSESSKVLKSHKDSPKDKSPWKPHKFKENRLVPKPKPIKPFCSFDYLGDQRRKREESEKEAREKGVDINENLEINWDQEISAIPEEERADFIKKKSKQLEKALKKKEVTMNNTVGANENLKINDDINDMLISSIKAKLAILEKSPQ